TATARLPRQAMLSAKRAAPPRGGRLASSPELPLSRSFSCVGRRAPRDRSSPFSRRRRSPLRPTLRSPRSVPSRTASLPPLCPRCLLAHWPHSSVPSSPSRHLPQLSRSCRPAWPRRNRPLAHTTPTASLWDKASPPWRLASLAACPRRERSHVRL